MIVFYIYLEIYFFAGWRLIQCAFFKMLDKVKLLILFSNVSFAKTDMIVIQKKLFGLLVIRVQAVMPQCGQR